MIQTESNSEKALVRYSEAYQLLYNRKPKDLRPLENGWVVVNGARMRVTELEYLTTQLQHEYRQGLDQRRTVVQRLLKWFKQN
ncbi:MAG TPA: hypothetical protein VHO69_06615 [Phototrophicaceae bacterium]|nr:hypothetical protein [Phototrophicaceae bacterium]